MVIDGIELDGFDSAGAYFHVLTLSTSLKLPTATRNFVKVPQAARTQGALLIWAHPHWTGNSPAEGLRHNFHGMEIYNHSPHFENGSGYALSHWDSVLNRHPDIFGFAIDDSHFFPGQPYWKGGWIMVNAAGCTQEEILSSIRWGNFYASQGPDFKTIEYSSASVRVETSPVIYARLIGSRLDGSWLSASSAAGNLFWVKAGWKSKQGPAAPVAANPCTFTCAVMRMSVFDVRTIPDGKHSTN